MADESLLRDIQVTKLTKATYNRWRIEIRDVLESYRIWEITTEQLVKPSEVRSVEGVITNLKEIDDWKTRDSKARFVIRSTLDDVTFDQVCDCETSADIMKRIKAFYEPKPLNALLELLRKFFIYSWKPSDTVGTFVAGLKVIARKIEALESQDFGNRLNEKLMMAKILGCLPKDFDSFVTSWFLLSDEMSLELFLEKLANAERNIEGRLDGVSGEAFKSQSKSTGDQAMKTIDNSLKEFKGECHECGKVGHVKRDCKSKPELACIVQDQEMEEDKARSEATFRYTVENVSKMKNSQLSPVTYVRNLPWKIMVRPPSSQTQSQRSLGFFLQCNGESESTSWSCYAVAELRLLSWKGMQEPFSRKIQHLFYSKENDWGFSYFMPWQDVLDPEMGYIKDDSITLEVHVVADAFHAAKLLGKNIGLKIQGALDK